jgi:hypothetical protein
MHEMKTFHGYSRTINNYNLKKKANRDGETKTPSRNIMHPNSVIFFNFFIFFYLGHQTFIFFNLFFHATLFQI